MKHNKIIFSLLLLAGKTYAQELQTLDEIIQRIETNHPSVKMFNASSKAMNEAAKGAYSWMPPEVGAGFFMTPYDPGRWKAMGNQPGMGSVMFSAQQMFPNKTKQEANFLYMQQEAEVELAKKQITLNDLRYIARKNYYEWIMLEKKLKVLAANKHVLEFMITSAEIRYRNGLGKISAYYKAKAALSNIENNVLSLESERKQKAIMLNSLMATDISEALLIDTQFRWINFDQLKLDSASIYAQRSDIKVLTESMKVNHLKREAELSALKPEFGLRFDHMMGWARQPWQFNAMVMVRIPFARWSAKMNRARAESLLWENEALKSSQQMILNETQGLAGNALTVLEVKKKQLLLFENQIMPALKRNFQTMQLAYEQNTEELFSLFDAWEALYMTELNYLDEMEKAWLMQAELVKLLEL